MQYPRRKQGFTLLEILVALVILVTGITMLSHMADVAMTDAEKSQDRSIVQVACQSRMNELLSGSEPIRPSRGERVEGLLNWTLWVEVQPVGKLDLMAVRVVARKHDVIQGGTALSAPTGSEYALVHWVDSSRIASMYPEGMNPEANAFLGQGGADLYGATMVGPGTAGANAGFGGPMGGSSTGGFGANASFGTGGSLGNSEAIDPFPNARENFTSPQMTPNDRPEDRFGANASATAAEDLSGPEMTESLFGPAHPDLLGFDDMAGGDLPAETASPDGGEPGIASSTGEEALSGSSLSTSGNRSRRRSAFDRGGSEMTGSVSERFRRESRLNGSEGPSSSPSPPRNRRRDVGPIEMESYNAENDFNLQQIEASRNRE